MRLTKARIKGYRCIKDTGLFDIENLKTILVGSNEAGKTAILQALQKINPPDGTPLFKPLRDYPRSKYDEDIVSGKVDPSNFTVVEGHFSLSQEDLNSMPPGFQDITFLCGRYLDNRVWHDINGGLKLPLYKDLFKGFSRVCSHVDKTYEMDQSEKKGRLPSEDLKSITQGLNENDYLSESISISLISWLEKIYPYIEEENKLEEERFDKLKEELSIPSLRKKTIDKCKSLIPKFILFNNYFRVKPSVHLELLANRTEQKILDDENYDYGNNCLLKLLGFTARELSNVAKASNFDLNNKKQLQEYIDKLDDRGYRLNAASLRLTNEIREIWNPNYNKAEASKLIVKADNQYLKVVVEDELGVEVELDQRSEGFQWLVSFFVVFFAEAEDKHRNAILLLDEPGLSLHGLKQAEFRSTISRLSIKNQTIFTTHSPFLVGADELDFVRVVEMTNREEGTIVHTTITAKDSASMLPLQEALGYDLAQTLFIHQKNLILEGLTDYWYLEAVSNLLREIGKPGIKEDIALIPASSASKVVYFATILHAQKLKVAALLDSDSAGDQAAKQDILVNTLGNKRIIRTRDCYKGNVKTPEIEDVFRTTLVAVAKDNLSWDIELEASSQVSRPISAIFSDVIGSDFSKYKLAKAFLHWSRSHTLIDLTEDEIKQCELLVENINRSLK